MVYCRAPKVCNKALHIDDNFLLFTYDNRNINHTIS